MNTTACIYAIARFSPYAETGEFANIGVVLLAPATGFFGFRLLERRYARVTRFFEELDRKTYRATVNALRRELERLETAVTVARGHGSNERSAARRLFDELVRPRETVIRFSEPRAVLADDAKAKLDALFSHYVHRDFVDRAYREAVLERGVRHWLTKARLRDHYTDRAIGDEVYQVKLPFVAGEHGGARLRAIKPLYLAHAEPRRIMKHGGEWVWNVERMERHGHVEPSQLLFAVEAPGDGSHRDEAAREVTEELRRRGSIVVPYSERDAVLEFAARAA